MSDQRESWVDVFRALGEAFVDVVRAEIEVLAEQWKRWGTKAGIAVGLSILALVLLVVYLPGLLIFAAIDALHETAGWPLWGSALAVAGLAFLVAALLLGIGYLLLRKEENPMVAAKGRLADHKTWWQDKMLGPEHRLPEGEDDEADKGDGAAG